MKKVVLLLTLSCGFAFATDPALRQFSLVKTNGDTVFTKDVFTRNGQTNLVCNAVTCRGVLESRTHEFYQDGVLVGEQWNFTNSTGFITEANVPFTMIFKSSPSNNISFAYLCSEDRIVIDYFIATNGVFYPVDTSAVQEARKLTTEIPKQVSPESE